MTLADLAPHVSKAYADIAPTNNDAAAEYRASVDLDATRELISPTPAQISAQHSPPEWPSGGPRRSSVASRWWGRIATT